MSLSRSLSTVKNLDTLGTIKFLRLSERNMSTNELLNFQEKDPLPFTYFAVFDGHAGTGAALMAVKLLQEHIQVNILIQQESPPA